MADISSFISKIQEATYGGQVRGAIADALQALNRHVASVINDTNELDVTDVASKLSSIKTNLETMGSVADYFTAPMLLTNQNQIAGKVTRIKRGAFSGINNFSSVNFPYVLTIGSSAFANCNGLKSVVLPSVSQINSNAFLGCSILESIYIGTSNCSIQGTAVFGGTPLSSSATLGRFGSIIFSNQEAYNYYLSAQYWSAYSARMTYVGR